MAHTDRARWDERYTDPAQRLKTGSHTLLARHAPPPAPGVRALELACGLGRDALWLAERGYRVDALDISLEALRQARAEMRRRALDGVSFVQADLDEFSLPHYAYDLVVVFRFLDRRLFPAIRARVRPGGLVIYETLNVRHLAQHPATNPAYMLRLGELPTHFPGWTVIEASDGEYTSAFVGRKPAEG
jgi:SAM-dependent methyltransferase